LGLLGRRGILEHYLDLGWNGVSAGQIIWYDLIDICLCYAAFNALKRKISIQGLGDLKNTGRQGCRYPEILCRLMNVNMTRAENEAKILNSNFKILT